MTLQDHPQTTSSGALAEPPNATKVADRTCIRVLSVDHHPLFREGIAAIINHQPDMALVSQASGGQDAIRQFREHRPDIGLMDVRLPDLHGIDALIAIRAEFPAARIIMLSSLGGDMEARRALKAGAYGYLFKDTDPGELLRTIREVHDGKKLVAPEVAAELAEHVGEHDLTTRERDVLLALCTGNRTRAIAELLHISEATVKVHISRIMQKLGAKDRAGAITIATRRGIIRL